MTSTRTHKRDANEKQSTKPKPAEWSLADVQLLGSSIAETYSLCDPEQDCTLDSWDEFDRLKGFVSRWNGRVIHLDFEQRAMEDMPLGRIRAWVDQDTKKPTFEIILRGRTETGPITAKEALLHEFGHLIVHYLKPERQTLMVADHSDLNGQDIQLAEAEAFWFAEGFLLPEAAFRKAYKQNKKASTLAKKFGVSELTVKNRADALGLSFEETD